MSPRRALNTVLLRLTRDGDLVEQKKNGRLVHGGNVACGLLAVVAAATDLVICDIPNAKAGTLGSDSVHTPETCSW
jgi:hypothetical protein